MQPLTIALGNYGVTKPIKAAGANLGRLNLRFVEVEQIVPVGMISPDQVITPSVLVDYIVGGA